MRTEMIYVGMGSVDTCDLIMSEVLEVIDY